MKQVVKFTPSQFTATQWATADEKATFANQLVRFILSDFKNTFTKTMYNRLNGLFDHIAHYNREGFSNTWFERTQDQLAFLEHMDRARIYGDPTYTWSDVERELQTWLRSTDLIEQYKARVAEMIKTRELAQLEHLKQKYEGETV